VAVGELFVDTSAWYPLLAAGHADHARVTTAFRAAVRSGQRVVVTNLIIAETHALLVARRQRVAAREFVRTVRSSATTIITSSEDLEERARVDWLERYGDHDFSFTDAVSFAVMRERSMARALTLDHHFAVAGFEMVPKGA
jgi:uncharacterized protein